jgi:hypothetical protein
LRYRVVYGRNFFSVNEYTLIKSRWNDRVRKSFWIELFFAAPSAMMNPQSAGTVVLGKG